MTDRRSAGLSRQESIRRPGEDAEAKRTGTVLYVHHDELEVDADGMKLKIALRDAVPLEQNAAAAAGDLVSGWSADVEQEGLPDRVNLLGLR